MQVRVKLWLGKLVTFSMLLSGFNMFHHNLTFFFIVMSYMIDMFSEDL